MSTSATPPRKRDDDGLDEAMVVTLTSQLHPVTPVAADTRERLLRRILDHLEVTVPQHRHHPARAGEWRVLADRVFLKVLERDDATGQATYLVRYSAGTSFPRHAQKSVEECLLVAGDLRIGDVDMRPGDLQIAVPGIEHGPLISEHGALVFVRGILSRVPDVVATGFVGMPGE